MEYAMKPVDPLFRRPHVHDADEGGPKPPSRNKRALGEEYNTAPPQSPGLNSGSLKMLSTPQPSSSQKVRPHQRSSHLGQSRMSQSHCDLQLHLDREKIANLSTISLPEGRHGPESDHLDQGSKLSQETEIYSKKPVKNLFAKSASVPLARVNVEQDDSAQRITRKRRESDMDVSLYSQIENTNKLSEYEERGSLGGKNDYSTPRPVLDLTPDDVVDKIGQRLFWKTRNTILRQQRAFALQKFELHRLIKVQRLIAGSPEVLHGNNFILKNPPKYKDRAQELNNGEKESSTPKSPNNPKKEPCCFHPPGNWWPVPVKSPSEGIIYKPFVGPFMPPIGITTPFSGNYQPINFGLTAYGQSYFQPYAMPMPQINLPSGLHFDTHRATQSYHGSSEAQGIHGSSDQNVKAIKVVPHINPTSAQESTARIFQSIQQERSKHAAHIIDSFNGPSSCV